MEYEQETLKAKEWLEKTGIGAMDLVRFGGISVTSAYKIQNGEAMKDLDVLYRLYLGLKKEGYEVTWYEFTGIQ
ncbi:MAG: hypothetical protein JW862_13110 [Anaerolineales bacterium]|nr:hypothetical protein [Anaerolineales bacterium]